MLQNLDRGVRRNTYSLPMEITLKRCACCQEQKPLSEYQKHTGTKDGLRCYCKACQRQKKKEYFQRYPEKLKEKNRKKNRHQIKKRRPSYRKCRARREKERYHNDAAYRERKKEMWRKAKALFPERQAARTRFQRAVRAGKIQKLPCVCGNPNSQGHHEDYSKPFEVVWMCASCHQKEHTKHLRKENLAA